MRFLASVIALTLVLFSAPMVAYEDAAGPKSISMSSERAIPFVSDTYLHRDREAGLANMSPMADQEYNRGAECPRGSGRYCSNTLPYCCSGNSGVYCAANTGGCTR